MNYPQKPVLSIAAQISVYSQEERAGRQHIILMGKPLGVVVFHVTKSSSESKLIIYLPFSGAYYIISVRIQAQFLGLISWPKKPENLRMNYRPLIP
ncbi:MAG: hypothetical protein EZS28_012218 [Streblomastix strix]|uniref:Uncharacterized protein n=1 Tax=Streblomastix strix TaxID=222440 RepID=A0A5J4WC64_9EUKA|nr:MAG: hypothetical protein EZS28_012218 [Streblomastix strix]